MQNSTQDIVLALGEREGNLRGYRKLAAKDATAADLNVLSHLGGYLLDYTHSGMVRAITGAQGPPNSSPSSDGPSPSTSEGGGDSYS